MFQRYRFLAMALMAAGLLLAACGSSSPSSKAPSTTASSGGATTTTTGSGGSGGGSSGSSTLSITIKNFMFHPSSDSVKPGAKITVTNQDSATHTLTALPGSSPQGHFNTGDLTQGKSATITAPTKPGTYKYYCQLHNFMRGELTVT